MQTSSEEFLHYACFSFLNILQVFVCEMIKILNHEIALPNLRGNKVNFDIQKVEFNWRWDSFIRTQEMTDGFPHLHSRKLNFLFDIFKAEGNVGDEENEFDTEG